MTFASSYPLLNAIWTMFVFFGFIIWLWMLFAVLVDVFRRHDISGWAKAGWTLFVIVLPFLGVLTYLIVHGRDMGERRAHDVQASQTQFDQHIRSVAGGPAGEISQAKELLDSGAITQAEFDEIKRHALANGGGERAPTAAAH
jgi:hypothetical protein